MFEDLCYYKNRYKNENNSMYNILAYFKMYIYIWKSTEESKS